MRIGPIIFPAITIGLLLLLVAAYMIGAKYPAVANKVW